MPDRGHPRHCPEATAPREIRPPDARAYGVTASGQTEPRTETSTALPFSSVGTLWIAGWGIISGPALGRLCLCTSTVGRPSTSALQSASCALPTARRDRPRRGRFCPTAVTRRARSGLQITAPPPLEQTQKRRAVTSGEKPVRGQRCRREAFLERRTGECRDPDRTLGRVRDWSPHTSFGRGARSAGSAARSGGRRSPAWREVVGASVQAGARVSSRL